MMEFNIRNEYGRRVNANIKVFALLGAALFGIFLAFNSEYVQPVNHSGDADPAVEYVVD